MTQENKQITLDDYFSDLELVIQRWSTWLNEIESAIVAGRLTELPKWNDSANEIVTRLTDLHRRRQLMLDDLSQDGTQVSNLNDYIDYCNLNDPAPYRNWAFQLRNATERLKSRNIAVWILAEQSGSLMAGMIHLIAMGVSSPATYSNREAECMTGGRLIDSEA